MHGPIDVFWCFIGLCVWPEMTLCVILWTLGHPLLGLFALFFCSTTSVKQVIREKIVDHHTGQVVAERTIEED